jgi:hypothetical protein
MPPYNTTLLGVVKGALDHFGTELSPAMAFGGSGHAFLINIHDELCPSGPYCWKYDRFHELVRNLGVEMTDLGFFHAGSPLTERAAIERKLTRALDQGLPCSFCNMENQLIVGYDVGKFLLAQPWPVCNELTPPALTFGTWSEFGVECHVNFFVLGRTQRADDAHVIRTSLDYALDLFRNPERFSRPHCGIGLKAYDNWLAAVEQHGAEHGNWWNAMVWSECRAMAADYFAEIAGRFPMLVTPATRLSAAYRHIAGLLNRVSDKQMPTVEKLGLLAELRAAEEAAVGQVEYLRGLLA